MVPMSAERRQDLLARAGLHLGFVGLLLGLPLLQRSRRLAGEQSSYRELLDRQRSSQTRADSAEARLWRARASASPPP